MAFDWRGRPTLDTPHETAASDDVSAASSSNPAPGAPARVAVDVDLLASWLGFADIQRRTLDAIQGELTRTSDHVEDSTLDLSHRFRELAE